jgi:hypothetical protein
MHATIIVKKQISSGDMFLFIEKLTLIERLVVALYQEPL